MKEENDPELCIYRSWMRDAYNKLDILQRDGNLNDLWLELHRVSNAAEKMKERINRLQYKK